MCDVWNKRDRVLKHMKEESEEFEHLQPPAMFQTEITCCPRTRAKDLSIPGDWHIPVPIYLCTYDWIIVRRGLYVREAI